MTFPATARTCLLLLGALLLGQVPAFALLNIDGTRNQLFVFGSAHFGYDSNIFSDSTNRGDYTMGASVGTQLKRHAGIIAVDATATLSYTNYGKYAQQNSFDPNFRIEFNKSAGRTTGALTISAYRENRADSSVNLRTTSWNFPIGLSFKYPVNDKYYFTSQTTYLSRRYVASTALANYRDISQALDLFYVYTFKLDLDAGYLIRISKTSIGNSTYDHSFNIGASGGLFAKLNGQVRLGYQIRTISGGNQNFTHLTALAAVTWPVTRKISLTGSLSRDFNTIATGATVDSFSAQLRANYYINRSFELNAGAGYGVNRFLGTPPPRRKDTFLSFDCGATYKLNEHFKVGATYTRFNNRSNIQFSEFDRNAFALDISSRF